MTDRNDDAGGRLVAKLLRELLQQRNWTCQFDLEEALKCRCARLRIRDYGSLVTRAVELVGSNTPLVYARAAVRQVLPPPVREMSRAEAATLLERLYARVALERAAKAS